MGVRTVGAPDRLQRELLSAVIAAAAVACAGAAEPPGELELRLLAGGFSRPVAVRAAGGAVVVELGGCRRGRGGGNGDGCLDLGGGGGRVDVRRLAMAGVETLLLEREATPGSHASSRNSEVIHAGIYYPPGSLKGLMFPLVPAVGPPTISPSL